MPLTTLDTVAALIVIDLQKGIVSQQTAQPAQEIVERSVRLITAFRRRGAPVVLVNVNGAPPGRTESGGLPSPLPADFSERLPELTPQPGDYALSKQRHGAFIGTSLDDYLHDRGVTQVFITGISTSVGVESTARCAYELGYNVVLVTDAMTDRNADAHRNSIERIFPRIGELTTTAEVLLSLSSAE